MDKQNMTTMHARDMQKVSAGAKTMGVLTKFITYAFLITMAIVVLFPFYWMIISSLKTLDVLLALCDRILVISSGYVTGIVDARTSTKEEIGLLMTKSGDQEGDSNG